MSQNFTPKSHAFSSFVLHSLANPTRQRTAMTKPANLGFIIINSPRHARIKVPIAKSRVRMNLPFHAACFLQAMRVHLRLLQPDF